ncbi:hypothetical protein CURTO8I2_140071 [Curtobacterium sp. 8I-2]|nr:hypothetical protein CURTO8I2_140071 [Curtobacterium sp. 8I-2]
MRGGRRTAGPGVLVAGSSGAQSHGAGAPWTLLRPFPQLAAFPLGEATPDAEAFVVLERVLEALRPDLARGADLLRLARRAALLGEERLGVGLCAQRVDLPGERVLLVVRLGTSDPGDAERHGIDVPVLRNSGVELGTVHPDHPCRLDNEPQLLRPLPVITAVSFA